jgi:lysozyme family protein
MADFIDEIIEREGGETATNDPNDAGGRTQFGISEKANPAAWADGVVTREEAREIYSRIYILAKHFERIEDVTLMHQVVDHGVMSGPDAAARMLQQVIGVPPDGIIGDKTIEAIRTFPDGMLFGQKVPGIVLINLAFRDAREVYYATATKKNPNNLKFLLGWIKRAQEFK